MTDQYTQNAGAAKHDVLDSHVVQELREICGGDNVIVYDPKRLKRYGRDQVSYDTQARPPAAAVLPDTPEQVEAIVRLAHQHRIPITPRGAGSGLSGGAVPIHGGIVLSVERMNRILEVDEQNLVAVVEPGVVTNDLDEALKESGLFFAGYPMSDEFCYIGGNVAENAGGGRAVKYGVTGRYVLGVEVVLPDGERIQVGGKRYKDVTGYDLLSLLVGSEGTLGIFTRIYLRLLPRPTERATVLSFFPSVDAAVDAIPRIVRDSGIVPTSVEFVDQLPLHKACEMLGETLPYQNAHAMLLLEADGRDAVVVQREAETMEEICRTSGASYVHRANDEADAERLWTIRKQVPWALRKYAQQQSLEDIALPPAALPDYIAELQMLASKYDVTIPSFGHAADGNLHATPLKRAAQTAEEWQETSGALLAEMYEQAARLGGTISGEHGIGHKRREYLPRVMSTRQIDLFRGIKDTFDPDHIMNPGKIVE